MQVRRTCRAVITSPLRGSFPAAELNSSFYPLSPACVFRSLPVTCLAQPSSIPCGLLSRKDREVLGLVLSDGLGYVRAGHEVAISSLCRGLPACGASSGDRQTADGKTWRIVWTLTALAGGLITPARHRAADRRACLLRTQQIPPPSVSRGAQPPVAVTTRPAGSPSQAPWPKILDPANATGCAFPVRESGKCNIMDIAPDPGSWTRDICGEAAGPGFFVLRTRTVADGMLRLKDGENPRESSFPTTVCSA
jgi:hypothetical protein